MLRLLIKKSLSKVRITQVKVKKEIRLVKKEKMFYIRTKKVITFLLSTEINIYETITYRAKLRIYESKKSDVSVTFHLV